MQIVCQAKHQAVEFDFEPMGSENQVKSSDLEPRVIVSNNSVEVLKKRDRGDIIAGLASFDPTSIVGYVRELGQSTKEGVDELEFDIAKAQMLAFSCWRDHSKLPEFSVLSGNLRCDTASVVLEGIECSSELSDDAPPGFECYRVMHDLIRSLNNPQVSNVRVNEHVASRAACFSSTRLVEYLKGLGGSPCGEVDISELAVAKAQLLAFTNLKGYSQLPELTLLDGYLASDTDLGVSGYENCSASIASAPLGFVGNESTHAVKRDLDGQTEQKKRPYRAVGCDLISPAACLEPTKLVSRAEVSGVSPCEGLGGSKLIYEEPKAPSSHLPEFNMLSGQISGKENLSNKLIEDSIPCNSNCGNHNVRTDSHTYQGQMDVQEKSNDSLRGEGVCRAACFDTMLYDHLGDDAYLKLMRQEYCCSDLVDDPPPGFEHYRMISHGQIDLNEELNQINEEEAVCTTPCFDNMKLIGYLRRLSKSPLEQLCESELIEAKSHLQAFFSWKGCSQLPGLTTYCMSLENNSMGLSENETCHCQLIGGLYPRIGDEDEIDDVSGSQDQTTNLRNMKQIPDGTIESRKRKRSSSFSSDENPSQKSKEEINCNTPCSHHMKLPGVLRLGVSEPKEANKVASKLDEVELEPSDEMPSTLKSSGNVEPASLSYPKDSCCSNHVVEIVSEHSVACGSSSLLEPIEYPEHVSISEMPSTLKSSVNIEPAGLSYPKDSCCNDHVVDKVSEDSVSSGSSSLMEPMEYPEHKSISELRSTLKITGNTAPASLSYPKDSCGGHVVEKAPEDSVASGSSSLMEPIEYAEHVSISKMPSTLKSTENIEPADLSKPKDSCCSDHVVEKVPEDSVASGSSSMREPREYPEHVSISDMPSTLKSSGDTEPAGLSLPKDSCCSDHLVEKVPEQQFIRNNQDAWNRLPQASKEEAYASSEWKISTACVPSEPDNLPGKSGVEVGETINTVGEDSAEPDYHTALVLTFINMAAVPSEGYLNKVFGCFGQLNEAETKLFNKRNGCRVVYRKHADAEAAFNGVGKHGIFRDTLLSYRLKYIHSKPARASTRTRKRKNDSASHALGGIQSPITLVGQQ